MRVESHFVSCLILEKPFIPFTNFQDQFQAVLRIVCESWLLMLYGSLQFAKHIYMHCCIWSFQPVCIIMLLSLEQFCTRGNRRLKRFCDWSKIIEKGMVLNLGFLPQVLLLCSSHWFWGEANCPAHSSLLTLLIITVAIVTDTWDGHMMPGTSHCILVPILCYRFYNSIYFTVE